MDDLRLFLSGKFDFKRKNIYGGSFDLLYCFYQNDIKYSILVEYIAQEIPRQVTIRARKGEHVAYVLIPLVQIIKSKDKVGILFDHAFEKLRLKIGTPKNDAPH
ncbi:hypothetical protein [Acinetobacter ursingii]|uniref:hypothetical protein n=1 Tax=Acinetobacter ursingii TaxID=108980 RepID=UPI00124BD35A|nr:hypothetical protein [Acinetobacter ursingii]